MLQYAMLAGYLPFDDDPANPEGDNINLLYKYIVSTPLTFPEYVTPHARDLLRRILVPDPRRRADLFEVARHSWLSEYSHVVGFIGSSTKSDRDIATSALQQEDQPMLGRSASVREPSSRSPAAVAGGPVQKLPSAVTDETPPDTRSKQRDNKRRTVQVEYVAPQGATARGDAAPTAAPAAPMAGSGRTRARGDGAGPIEVTPTPSVQRKEVPTQAMPPPSKPGRDQMRAVSDTNAFAGQPSNSASRPVTRETLGGGARLPSRGNSYSQPVAATPTTENAQGRFSQPKPSAGYIISSPIPSDRGDDSSRPVSQQNLGHFNNKAQPQQFPQHGHKRSSTLGSIGDRLLGRSNSRRSSKGAEAATPVQNEKRDRKYPPVSMRNAMPQGKPDDATPRQSTESRRRPSFTFGRKNSDTLSERRSSKRFSFLPGNFSMSNFGGGGKKDQSGYESDARPESRRDSMQRPGGGGRPQSKGGVNMAFGRGQSRDSSQSTSNSTIPLYYEADREAARGQRRSQQQAPLQQQQGSRYEKALPPQPNRDQQVGTPPAIQRKQHHDDGYGGNAIDQQEPVERFYTPHESPLDRRGQQQQQQARPDQYNSAGGPRMQQQQQQQYQQPNFKDDDQGINQTAPLSAQNNIRPQQRKFDDAYDQGHAGSSSGARRVMDFFRRRGKDRTQV